ncbi:aldose 1-epimerase family protein [uncultured Corynebacterium sp.]|uniref:aldose 1-epimerase family protein n=1 Tax=uncultured Corynebacterium sp. TaxID=159447 RepID=UPI0025CFFF15|nr:aldose 1-epimerase family protein [uncultured Corynebacterium sp.]
MTTSGGGESLERPRHEHPFIEISSGEYRADISAFGGGPRSLEHDGRPLLVDYPRGEFPPLSAATLLAPWPNRVTDGVFIHDGVVHRMQITEPGRSNAIHGFVANRAWDFVEAGRDHVTLSIEPGPQPGWNWPMRLTVRWSVDADAGLRADVTVENLGTDECPFGFGFHPYLSAAGADLSDCVLSVAVEDNLPLEPVRNLPAGPEVPADRVVPGLSDGVLTSGLWLDHCFTSPPAQGPDDGTAAPPARARLVGPDGAGVEMWADDRFGWFQIFTADPARREGFPRVGRALAVEPMTCPPDALRSGRDLIRIPAGGRTELSLGIRAAT